MCVHAKTLHPKISSVKCCIIQIGGLHWDQRGKGSNAGVESARSGGPERPLKYPGETRARLAGCPAHRRTLSLHAFPVFRPSGLPASFPASPSSLAGRAFALPPLVLPPGGRSLACSFAHLRGSGFDRRPQGVHPFGFLVPIMAWVWPPVKPTGQNLRAGRRRWPGRSGRRGARGSRRVRSRAARG